MNHDLICKKKYHDEASTIATHLSVHLYEAYRDPILSIFTPEFLDQAKSCTWVDGQPLFSEEKVLKEANKMQFDFLISLKEELLSKKYMCIYEEDDLTLGSLKTLNYFKPKADESMELS